MDLRIDDYALGGRIHAIEVRGEIDLYTAPKFKEHILTAIGEGETRVVVDLSGVSFMDSTALGVLAGVLKRLRGADGALSIVVKDYDIERLFESTRLDGTFRIYRSRDDALEDLAGARHA
jgi:anti-sigma B factor antagonist